MIQYDIHIIIDEKLFENRLHRLANRLEPINGWNERDILNFSTNAFQSYFMPCILSLLEEHVDEIEKGSI